MYDALDDMDTVNRTKKTTPERAAAMKQAATKLGHLSVSDLPLLEGDDPSNVARVHISGLVHIDERLGPFFDATNAIIEENKARAASSDQTDIPESVA